MRSESYRARDRDVRALHVWRSRNRGRELVNCWRSKLRCTATASFRVCHAPNFGSRQLQGLLRGRNFQPDMIRYASASNGAS